jgi:predicted membrane GTPase involved in stress response
VRTADPSHLRGSDPRLSSATVGIRRDTKGLGIFSSRFIAFKPYAGEIDHHDVGSMISMEKGKASPSLSTTSNSAECFI